MTKRKPDYVFNVWEDNVCCLQNPNYEWSARMVDFMKKHAGTRWGHGVTHRIRVYMKAKA